jgi:hypothetical protein
MRPVPQRKETLTIIEEEMMDFDKNEEISQPGFMTATECDIVHELYLASTPIIQQYREDEDLRDAYCARSSNDRWIRQRRLALRYIAALEWALQQLRPEFEPDPALNDGFVVGEGRWNGDGNWGLSVGQANAILGIELP